MTLLMLTPEEATKLGLNPFSGCHIYCRNKPKSVLEKEARKREEREAEDARLEHDLEAE